MSIYDSEYLLAFPIPENDEIVSLKPDNKTAKSGIGKSFIEPGRPLFFETAYTDYIPEGTEPLITDIMFATADLVVNERVKGYLEKFKIDNLQIYPAVYVDLNGKYHENLWFLNFYERLDCWNRDRSTIYSDELMFPLLDSISLDEELLNKIPEENRLAFTLGGVGQTYVLIHNKVVEFLKEINATGLHTIPLKEYELGMEDEPIF